MIKVAKRAGRLTHMEPVRFAPGGQKKLPDILLTSTMSLVPPIYVDICVSHPALSSYAIKASRTTLSTARTNEQHKHRSYDPMAELEGGTFKAFACESVGALGVEADQLLIDLCKEQMLHEEGSMAAALACRSVQGVLAGREGRMVSSLRWARGLVAVALAVGNAQMAERVIRQSIQADFIGQDSRASDSQLIWHHSSEMSRLSGHGAV